MPLTKGFICPVRAFLAEFLPSINRTASQKPIGLRLVDFLLVWDTYGYDPGPFCLRKTILQLGQFYGSTSSNGLVI
jgi:hypothetical protein